MKAYDLLVWTLLATSACNGDDGGSVLDAGGTLTGTSGSTSLATGPGDTGTTSGADDSESDGDSGSESSGGFVEIDCTDACADQGSEAGTAVCYACRCKNAMDGYMPSPEEVQCSHAEPLEIYVADVSGPQPEVVAATEEPAACVNPSLLYETCQLGSRLGQLQEGTVHVKWICRDPIGNGIYNDVGVIMHNTRNGASCWFDDIDTVTGENDLPDLDLMGSDQANLDNYMSKFYFTDGGSCTSECHDADPFVYTPYFQAIQWDTGSFVTGRHARVQLDGSLASVAASHLVSPDVMVCAGCHRIGSAAGCDFLSPDAFGDYKGPAHEQAVLDATEPGSPNWKLAYWMPNNIDEVTTQQLWEQLYGAARDRINECCAAPGVTTASCLWEPIPGPE